MKEQFPYSLLNKKQISSQMNYLGALGIPFLFIIDYKTEFGYVIKEVELDKRFIRFQSQSMSQGLRVKRQESRIKSEQIEWELKPISQELYKLKFDYVQQQIHQGNSFLTNLTQPTEVKTNLTLLQLFQLGLAKYKLWINSQFTVLSPETFVQIHDGRISSFPMKGTIDAAIPNAAEIILNDPKEQAEHATIVDLIRNDLSLVADHVEVKRYRYIEKLTTNRHNLLQVSSEICGKLPKNYRERLADIIFSLLPAGSISGAPKPKTLEIIEKAEEYNRGFYTGVCGWFDGENLDSAVMIRFIEQQGEKLIFKSGGGITAKSELNKEYEELIQKIYVPVF